MRSAVESLVKVAAFARKELVDLVRQPRLVLTLVLGPFLILALFGAGYQRTASAMRAVLVIPAESEGLREELQTRLAGIDGSISVVRTVTTEDEALDDLENGRADVAVVVPRDPYATVRSGEQAVFTLLHDTQDPFEQATIRLIARAGIDELNRELLAETIAAGQNESAEVSDLLATSRESAALLREAVEEGDFEEARAQRDDIDSRLSEVGDVVGPADPLTATLGSDDAEEDSGSRIGDLRNRIIALELSEDSDAASNAEEIAQIEADIADLEVVLADFQRIEADVLVSPLGVETQLISPVEVTLTDFYAPGVIALLLQHLAITFAAMSLVRERSLGTAEVFGVAPVGPNHILLGKYIGYTAGAAIVAVSLNLLLLLVFDVPLAGSLGEYALVQALLTVASLGVGFVISAVVTTDNQAVNAAMIVLLLSIFFSGFFLSLERLLPQVRVVSWLLPITHGLDSMRDIMFRGTGIDPRTWIALGGGAVVMYLAAWALTRRRMRTA